MRTVALAAGILSGIFFTAQAYAQCRDDYYPRNYGYRERNLSDCTRHPTCRHPRPIRMKRLVVRRYYYRRTVRRYYRVVPRDQCYYENRSRCSRYERYPY